MFKNSSIIGSPGHHRLQYIQEPLADDVQFAVCPTWLPSTRPSSTYLYVYCFYSLRYEEKKKVHLCLRTATSLSAGLVQRTPSASAVLELRLGILFAPLTLQKHSPDEDMDDPTTTPTKSPGLCGPCPPLAQCLCVPGLAHKKEQLEQ